MCQGLNPHMDFFTEHFGGRIWVPFRNGEVKISAEREHPKYGFLGVLRLLHCGVCFCQALRPAGGALSKPPFFIARRTLERFISMPFCANASRIRPTP